MSTPTPAADLSSALVQDRAELPPRAGWAMLLRAPRLALATNRLWMALLGVIFLMGVGTVFDYARGPIDAGGLDRGVFESLVAGVVSGAGLAGEGVMTLNPPLLISGVASAFWAAPAMLGERAPWSLLALVVVLLPIWSFFGGAISRSAIVEVARQDSVPAPEAMAFAVRHRASLVGAPLAPAVVAAGLVGAIWVFGRALLWLPGLDIAGGTLYGVAIAMGLMLSVIVCGFAAVFPLLIPAVAADATDAIDAVQRAYSYVIDKPARYLLWAAALVAQGAAGLFVVTFLLVTALNWTAELAVPGHASAVAGEVRLFRPLPEHAEAEGTWAVAAAFIGVWERVTLAVAGAFALSFFFCASSMIYLRLRLDCDGQAVDDIWPRRTVIEMTRRGARERLPETHAGGAGTEQAEGPGVHG